MKLKPTNTRDEIVLAMLKDRSTFLQMFNRTEGLIRQGKDNIKKDALVNHFNAEDELIIPAIKFRMLQHYAALDGLTFSSNYGEIESFDQSIDFNFDRHGVTMESTAGMVDSVGMPQKPKLLYFNKPFYLYIKEAGVPYPYFNLWIANPQVLEKQKI